MKKILLILILIVTGCVTNNEFKEKNIVNNTYIYYKGNEYIPCTYTSSDIKDKLLKNTTDKIYSIKNLSSNEWLLKNDIIYRKRNIFKLPDNIICNLITPVNVEYYIDSILSNPLVSSNPYDYIYNNIEDYNYLLNNPLQTFEYAISDLIKSNGNDGLKSYIEVLLCNDINNYKIQFSNAKEWLESYISYLKKLNFENGINAYDMYVYTLINLKISKDN